MAKWNYVFLIERLFIFIVLHYGCPEKIDMDVCLETAIDFAWSDDACWFLLTDARSSLGSGTRTCSEKCNVKIDKLKAKAYNRYGYYTPVYQLRSLALRFDGLSENLKTINTQCDNNIAGRTLEITCQTGSKIVYKSEDLCTSNTKCGDASKKCLRSSMEKIGICVCRSEYIAFGSKCLEGNLQLNEKCQRSQQCSGTVGSICQNNTCVCRPGYVPINDSNCFSPTSDRNAQANVRGQKEDNTVIVTVGAVFGGLILGIVLTVLVVTIYKNIRNGKPKTGKKQDPKVAFFNNASYDTGRDADQNHSTVQQTIERKIVNVPPFAHSMDSPVMENTYTNKSSMANSHDVNNDVYNHLHEKKADSDIDETYDHAHENINRTMEESDYSNLNTGRRYMGPGVSATEDNDYDER